MLARLFQVYQTLYERYFLGKWILFIFFAAESDVKIWNCLLSFWCYKVELWRLWSSELMGEKICSFIDESFPFRTSNQHITCTIITILEWYEFDYVWVMNSLIAVICLFFLPGCNMLDVSVFYRDRLTRRAGTATERSTTWFPTDAPPCSMTTRHTEPI